MSNSTFNKTGSTPRREEPTSTTQAYKEFKQTADEYRDKDFPVINTIGKDIKYDHSNPQFGPSLGGSSDKAAIMAAKFAKASAKARQQGGSYLSKTVQNVLPTLTPEEIAFCIGVVVREKMAIEQRMGGDIQGLMREMGINPEDL